MIVVPERTQLQLKKNKRLNIFKPYICINQSCKGKNQKKLNTHSLKRAMVVEFVCHGMSVSYQNLNTYEINACHDSGKIYAMAPNHFSFIIHFIFLLFPYVSIYKYPLPLHIKSSLNFSPFSFPFSLFSLISFLLVFLQVL